MKLQKMSSIRQSLMLSLAIMLLSTMASCGSPTAAPVPTFIPTNSPEPTLTPAPVPPSPPTLNRSTEVTLNAGDQLAISASSEGANSFTWELQGPGTLSSNTGSAVIYTAPDGDGGIAILSVVASNAEGLSSLAANMTINVHPGVVTITKFEFDTPNEGSTLTANQPNDCTGTYELSFGTDTTGIYVWILAGDDFGNYYLQNPPVSFNSNGIWSTSVRPGEGITKLFAVQVTEAGNDIFNRKVENGDFKGFIELPDGSITHLSIDIQTQ